VGFEFAKMKGAKMNRHIMSLTFKAAKLKSFTVYSECMYQIDGKYSERVQIPARAIADFLPIRYVTLPFAHMIQQSACKCKM